MRIKGAGLHEMVLLILIIGMFNIYDILKNINISIYDVININEKNILYLATLTLFFTATLLFFKPTPSLSNRSETLEFELILGLGFIGLFFLLLANDLLLFFLALELYSLSVYLLLFKNKIPTAEGGCPKQEKEGKITILYFLLGSISSSLILFGISLLYNSTGSLDMKYIFQNIDIIASYTTEGGGDNVLKPPTVAFGLALFLCGLLFKIGSAPFQFWVIRVYTQMDLKILMYQSIVPKIAYIFVLSYFTTFGGWAKDPASFLMAGVVKLLLFSAFLSLFIGPIGAISNGINKLKKLIAYSSILHVGYLLLGLVANTQTTTGGCGDLNIFQYLLIYGLNTLQFGLAFFFLQSLFAPTSKAGVSYRQDGDPTTTPKVVMGGLNTPLLLLFFLISIFSFIGLPPFAGFYAKLNIVLNCFYTNNLLLQFFAILFIIFSTLIAAFLYLKFFNFFFFTPQLLKMDPILTATGPQAQAFRVGCGGASYLLSFLSLFLLVYPIYLPYLSPIFELFSTI